MKINNKEKVEKVDKFLKCFSKISNKKKRDFIKDCPHTMITCFSEICFNILKNKHLKKSKKRTGNVRKQMKWMSNPKNPCNKRRALLLDPKFGNILFDIIAENLVPFLNKLLKNKSDN